MLANYEGPPVNGNPSCVLCQLFALFAQLCNEQLPQNLRVALALKLFHAGTKQWV